LTATTEKSYDVTVVLAPKWDIREPWTAPAYICQYLRFLGYRVQFIDYNIRLYTLCKEVGFADLWTSSAYHQPWHRGKLNFLADLIDLDEIKGDVVGFSCTATNRLFSVHLSSLIRRRYPDKKVIMGGHDLYFESDVASVPNTWANAICKGEGEHTIRDVMARDFKNLEEVPGLYLPHNGGWRLTSDRPPIRNLDDIPWPTFEEVDMTPYEVPDLPLMASRGCVARCIFCNDRIRTPLYRCRSAKNQVDELQYLKERYDTDFFIYNDPLMNGNLRIMEEKADEILRRGLKVKYGGNVMVHSRMRDEFFHKLRKSGLTVAIMGVESGSDTTLKHMRKLHTREEAAAFLRKCHNAGMRVEINMIVGFPTETEEHFQETLSFLRENRDYIDCMVSAATFNVAYSDLWHQLDKFGIVTYERNAHNSWHTKDMKNTLEVRLDRLNRIIETAAELGIANVRTDYEIEENKPAPDEQEFLDTYMAYWREKKDHITDERAEALARGRQMHHQIRRRRAISFFDRLGILPQVVWLRRRLLRLGPS